MTLIYNYLFVAIWLSYAVYWSAMSASVKATERLEPASSRLARLVLMVCAIALICLTRVPIPLLNERFLPHGTWAFWSGAAITACGLLFSVWARRHLGRNWSQAVTLKKDHELITSGPYALVRHPIYTGLVLGILGSAVARGEWRGIVAVALVFVALWRKLRLEEKWMREQFGESYEAYSQKVAALVPYII
ncbi:MAG TPA: isoprenylcysteine carboxylmethyltransferase family protein [Acidobacteriota bacterium]|nr:isoprenylcysteine carboxylmethyltransferase family protein [Acidobacteriota bacterium]